MSASQDAGLKRKAHDDVSPDAPASSRRKRDTDSNTPLSSLQLSEKTSLRMEVLANIPPNIAFFKQTADEVFEECSRQAVVTKGVIQELIIKLRELNTKDEQVVAAENIWQNKALLQTSKMLGTKFFDTRFLETAMLAMLEAGSADPDRSNITVQFKAKLKHVISQCFLEHHEGALSDQSMDISETGLDTGAQSTLSHAEPVMDSSKSLPAGGQGGSARLSFAMPRKQQLTPVGVMDGASGTLQRESLGHVQDEELDLRSTQRAQSATSESSSLFVSSDAKRRDRLEDIARVGSPERATSYISLPRSPRSIPNEDGAATNESTVDQSGRGHQIVDEVIKSISAQPLRNRPYNNSNITCFFWFNNGSCTQGQECKYSHRMLKYVANFPRLTHKAGPLLEIQHGATIENTRRATLSGDTLTFSDAARQEHAERTPTRPPGEARVLAATSRAGGLSSTPIVDKLVDISWENSTPRAIATSILTAIRARAESSTKPFITYVFDEDGKYTSYAFHGDGGLTIKLREALLTISESPSATRRALERMLRPFVVANKAEFTDLPPHAFVGGGP